MLKSFLCYIYISLKTFESKNPLYLFVLSIIKDQDIIIIMIMVYFKKTYKAIWIFLLLWTNLKTLVFV